MADQNQASPFPGLSRDALLKGAKQIQTDKPDSQRIYLDYNATAPMRAEVYEALIPYLTDCFGNASSLHRTGQHAQAALERARASCAEVLGCEPGEIVFTSGGTESDNLAIRGLAWGRKTRGKHLVSSAVEHPAVRETVQALEAQGFEATQVNPGIDGVVSAKDMLEALTDSTTVLALMYANNETGVIQPVRELGQARNRERVGFHVDAVQAAGRLPLNVKELGCDTLALSGHKLGGPKGVGLLYIRSGVAWMSTMTGGRQEGNRRSGTQNVAGVVGFAKALSLAEAERERDSQRIRKLRDQFENDLTTAFPKVEVLGKGTAGKVERIPNTSYCAFSGLEAEDVVNALDLEGLEVSTGSACSEGTHQQSHVLQAMNVPEGLRRGAIRFSLGRETTEQNMQEALVRTKRVVSRLYAR